MLWVQLQSNLITMSIEKIMGYFFPKPVAMYKGLLNCLTHCKSFPKLLIAFKGFSEP